MPSKLQKFLYLTLAAKIKAEPNQMIEIGKTVEKQVVELLKSDFSDNETAKAITEELNSNAGNELNYAANRNLYMFTQGDYASIGWERILAYGCWCNFQDFRNVKGLVQDDYDNNCKKLHDNYLCTIADSENAGEIDCKPDRDQYKSDMLHNMLAMAIAYKMVGFTLLAEEQMEVAYDYCASINEGSVCLTGACKSEAKFIYDVQPGIMYAHQTETFPKFELVHVTTGRGPFDVDSTCLAQDVETEPACCGIVPLARRYNTLANQDCCRKNDAAKVFSNLHQCCGENGVEIVGSCV